MHLSEPTQIITPTLDGPTIGVLAHATVPLTASDVHRLARRGSRDGIRRALNRLVTQGIVEQRSHGQTVVYLLNRHHLGAAAVTELAALTIRLVDAIRDAITAWELPPIHASLFGSIARGDADEASDLDLFLVLPRDVDELDERWNRQLGTLKVSVWSWSGNDLQIVERSLSELYAETESPFMASLREEAQHLVGERLASVLPPTSA